MRFLATIWLLLTLAAEGQTQPTPENILASSLDDYMNSAHDAFRFNGMAVVLSHGKVLLEKGYGCSDWTTQSPISTHTRFPLLSITKSFTATVILKLQEEGRISLDDPLDKYVAGYPNGNRITIRQLLSHTSGIHNYTDDVDETDTALINHPLSRERVIAQIRDKPIDFKPGKGFSYNNSGYFLLGLVIEKALGKSYEEAVRKYILTPAGMIESGFDFLGLPSTLKATGYQVWSETEITTYNFYDSSYAWSAGALYSSGNDMIRWASAILKRNIISSEDWQLAFNPGRNQYGLGWQTGTFAGASYAKHSGGYPGFMSEFIYYPHEELFIILLNNFGTYGQSVWPVAMGLSSIVLGKPYDLWKKRQEVDVPQELLRKYVGTYSYQSNRISVKFSDSRLWLNIPGIEPMALHAESDRSFYLINFNTSLKFSDGQVLIHEHGEDLLWKRKH